MFQPLVQYLEKDFTLISIDLPGHGQTTWKEGTAVQPKELADAIAELAREHQREKVSLLGYSLGGRVCLSIIAEKPSLVDVAALVAPDGLVFNPLYFWATRTVSGRIFFKDLLTKPDRYIRVLGRLRGRNWLNESRYQFAVQYLQSEGARRLLHQAWPPLRLLTPSTSKVKGAIRQHHIPVHLFMGVRDKVIPLHYAETFAKGAPDVHLYRLRKGHRVMDSDTIPQMVQCLKEVTPS
jgi:pimeloyl-ACP methyl ester carboxylesterase